MSFDRSNYYKNYCKSRVSINNINYATKKSSVKLSSNNSGEIIRAIKAYCV